MASYISKGFVALVYKWQKLPAQQAAGNEIALWDSLQGSDRWALSVDKEALGSIKGHYRDVSSGTCDRRCGRWIYLGPRCSLLYFSAGRFYSTWAQTCVYNRGRVEDTELKRNHDLCLQTYMLMVSQETCSGLQYQQMSSSSYHFELSLSLSLSLTHTHTQGNKEHFNLPCTSTDKSVY